MAGSNQHVMSLWPTDPMPRSSHSSAIEICIGFELLPAKFTDQLLQELTKLLVERQYLKVIFEPEDWAKIMNGVADYVQNRWEPRLYARPRIYDSHP
jgi:hypothetical protein